MAPVGCVRFASWLTCLLAVLQLNSCYGQAPYSVRLVNGTSPGEGRVEVLYKGQWNTICDDFWNLEEAQVVCRQLGYGTDFVVARGSAYYGEGSGPIRQAQCSGLESNLGSCSLTSGDSECSHSEDAGVNCEETYSVRLVDGQSPSEGRVEILYNGQWNTICDDYWSLEEAQVVCRQLGYDTDNATPKNLAYYGQGSGPILLAECSGFENTLNSCALYKLDYVCSHSMDAGVRCELGISNVRLVNGPSPSEGRVEIWYNGQWNTICDDFGNLEEAQVVCRQLGYDTDNVTPMSSAYYGQGSGPIQGARCYGWEDTLESCTLTSVDSTCGHYQDGGVKCEETYSVRLVNGPSPSEGRVEILYNGQWNTICDDYWHLEEAQVVCLQLGYATSNVTPKSLAYYGQGSGSILQVQCSGLENTLNSCILSSGDYVCSHSEDAGVKCEAPYSVRLVNGPSPNEGRIEILYNDEWNTICDDYWNLEEAEVVCRQLGYSTDNVVARSSAYYGQGSGPIQQVRCSGWEETLESCTLTSGDSLCRHYEDAGVRCGSDIFTTYDPFQWPTTTTGDEIYNIRLMNGPSPREGRVEMFYNGRWNTICDDSFNLEEAQVVCRQLGYDTDNVTPRGSAYYGEGSGSIRLVQCSGWEYTLGSCSLTSGDSVCRHYEDAGVRCGSDIITAIPWQPTTTSDGIYNVRLMDGQSPREGRVEMFYNGRWNTICDDYWNLEEAQVACRQLGYSTDNVVPRSYAYYGEGSGPIQQVQCYGWEYTLDHCTLSSGDSVCSHSEDAGVECVPTYSTSSRVIGMMSFVGVSLFILTLIAMVAVLYTCRKRQKPTPVTVVL
ncbi:deleted in malignant brain tumors 1 protein isoform X1 [Strongylocentrotus purpuratus]|uniref:SRCR domain-containing protein n=1 Tax=Strongylocentrotus purpuratus TaxID=7668 RepID=A0A7M7P8C2_STRPU|nr:deleted in malignant brain tumors 1 protein isoform X1 [Strongylocentrotus purpuratus]